MRLKYPKIQSLFKRDESTHIFVDEFSRPEFGKIEKWLVQEKIDGTNVRIQYNGESVTFHGRETKSQLPDFLVKCLAEYFTPEKFKSVFGNQKVILYGEGYGPKIQEGTNYATQVGFALFDILHATGERIDESTGNSWPIYEWLDAKIVHDFAQKLGLKPIGLMGVMSVEEIVAYVTSKPKSQYAIKNYTSEGVIARAYDEPEKVALFEDVEKNPIAFKLKVKDVAKCNVQAFSCLKNLAK